MYLSIQYILDVSYNQLSPVVKLIRCYKAINRDVKHYLFGAGFEISLYFNIFRDCEIDMINNLPVMKQWQGYICSEISGQITVHSFN